MSRYPVQDGLTGQRAPNVRSTIQPASLSDRTCHLPGPLGHAGRNLNRVRQDGVRILERGDLFDSEKLTHIESSDGKESYALQERLFDCEFSQ